jgi:hypothetical protein
MQPASIPDPHRDLLNGPIDAVLVTVMEGDRTDHPIWALSPTSPSAR